MTKAARRLKIARANNKICITINIQYKSNIQYNESKGTGGGTQKKPQNTKRRTKQKKGKTNNKRIKKTNYVSVVFSPTDSPFNESQF